MDSFVGAIGLGWIFATAVEHFANIFVVPFRGWALRNAVFNFHAGHNQAGPAYQLAALELFESVLLLVIGYVLLRWLYPDSSETAASLIRPAEEGPAAS